MRRTIHPLIPLSALLTACPPAEPIDPTGSETGVTAGSVTGDTGTPTTTGESDTSTGGTSTGDPGTGETGSTDETGSTGQPGTGETGSTGEPGSTGETGSTDASSTGSTGPVEPCEPGAIESCYSGDPATVGVGPCVMGERTCGAQGSWGACLGEVVPAVELCGTPGDVDCDGAVVCDPLQWHLTFGTDKRQEGVAVAFDAGGDLVLLAYGADSSDFGGGPLVSAGQDDVYLARFAPDGKHLWSKRFGDAASQYFAGGALAIDAAGDIYFAGPFQGKIDLGGGQLVATGFTSLVLGKFTADGEHVWSKVFPAGDTAGAGAIAFDGTGDLLLAGGFSTSIDLGGGKMFAAGDADAYVAKFGPDGAHKWSRRFGDAARQSFSAVVTTATDDVCIGGSFTGTLDLGSGPMTAAGKADVVVGCLDPDGEALWSKRFGDAEFQTVDDLAIDSEGRLTLVGFLHGAIDFGGGKLGGDSFQSYIAQLDGQGGHVWSRMTTPDSSGDATNVEIGVDDAVLVAGTYYISANLGGATFEALGERDNFLLELGPGGQHVWSRVFGGYGSDFSHGLAVSPTGAIALTGSFFGTTNLGGPLIAGKGHYDGFVAVYGP